MYHVNVNASLTLANVTWMKNGIMIHVVVSSKIQNNIIYAKKIIVQILEHVIVKMVNI